MNKLTTTFALVGVLGLGLVAGAQATILLPTTNIEIVPTGNTAFTVGQAGATASFEVRVKGMQSQNTPPLSLGAYDFGIAYDPSIMTLSSFGGFTGALGDEGIGDVLNAGPADPFGNADWNYQTFVNTLWTPGTFNGTALGIPTKDAGGTPPYWEGSLRFSQLSFLDDAALKGLQSDDFLLFDLSFDIDTTVAGSTALAIIDDRDYAGFAPAGPGQDVGQLDYKSGVFPVTDNYYLNRVDSGVTVSPAAAPAPTTLLLMLGALAPLLVRRRRCSVAAQGEA